MVSVQRKNRADKRAEHLNPENFTCGKCRQVHAFNEGYVCDNDEEEVVI